MQEWEPKAAAERRTRVYFLPYNKRAANVTISAVTATCTKDPDSEVDDPTPSGLLNGSAITNTGVLTYGEATAAIGQAVLVPVWNGVVGCKYIIRLTMTLSTGEIFVEDIKQRVITYVPTP